MEKEYAHALSNALTHGSDEKKLVTNLMKHLEEKGRLKLLPSILRELKKMAQQQETLLPHVEAASESEAANAKKMAAAVGIKVEKATVNPSLIRGWRARIGASLVDVSAKKALIDLYRNITH